MMNIMLANVLERRREIGLLRVIGARGQHIVQRFLREALVICAAGALMACCSARRWRMQLPLSPADMLRGRR